MEHPFTPEVHDLCLKQRALITHLEKLTVRARLSDIRLARKFNRLKRSAEEFIEYMRRS